MDGIVMSGYQKALEAIRLGAKGKEVIEQLPDRVVADKNGNLER